MKARIITVLAVALMAVGFGEAKAQQTTQNVTVDVDPINVLAVSGNPGTLTISTAVAGSAPDNAVNNSTTYDVTTNETNKKLVAKLDAAYAAGVTLNLDLQAPAGGGTSAPKDLSTIDQDLVTGGFGNLAESGLTITYTASATVAAAPNAGETRTVTITITDV